MSEQQNPDYPFIAPELIPFIAPLRAKIQEHHDWLAERGYTYGIGPEAEYRRVGAAYPRIVAKLDKDAEKQGLYYISKNHRGIIHNGFNSENGADKRTLLETRGTPQDNGIEVCDNVYAIRKDLLKATERQISPGPLEIVSEHYHLHVDWRNIPQAIIQRDRALSAFGNRIASGLIEISDNGLPLSVPLAYLMKSDGHTSRFSCDVTRFSSYRIKLAVDHFTIERDTLEQRANLKGSEALPEIAVCRFLGGIRLGIEDPDIAYRKIAFLPQGKKWDEHYAEKLREMKTNEAVLQCYGEEAVEGLAKYFAQKLELFRADLSLQRVGNMAKSAEITK